MIRALLVCLLLLSCAVAFASTDVDERRLDVHGRVPAHLLQTARSPLRVVLNGGKHSTLVRADGSFTLRSVRVGVYLLEVHSVDFVFEQVFLDVGTRKEGKIRALVKTEDRRRSVPYPLVLDPVAYATYFEERPPFDISTIYKNPIYLLVGFFAVVYLVASRVDPEEFKKAAKQQNGADEVDEEERLLQTSPFLKQRHMQTQLEE